MDLLYGSTGRYYRLADLYTDLRGYHTEFHDLHPDLRGCLRIYTTELSIQTLQICVTVHTDHRPLKVRTDGGQSRVRELGSIDFVT